MCDVGVKIFIIFFKTTKKNKKNSKMFCRLQKDLYLCSVNKKTTKHMKEYIIIYGLANEKEHYFKERNRECVSKSTYYRRKKVWKNPPIGVTITENKSWNVRVFFVGFDD